MSYRSLIEQTEGVTGVAAASWFGGLSQEPGPDGEKREEFFAQFATDIERYLPLYPEMKVPPEQLRDLLNDRMGCMLGEKIAERLGKRGRRPARAAQHHLDAEERLVDLGVQRPRHLHDRFAHLRPDDDALSPETIRRSEAVRPGLRGAVHPRHRRSAPLVRSLRGHRRPLREQPLRNTDDDREGVQPAVRLHDGQLPVAAPFDRQRRRADHAAGLGQHDDDERPRADARDGHPQGHRLQRRPRLPAADRRGAGDLALRRARPASDWRGCSPTCCTTTRNPTSSPSSICRLGRCSPPWVWRC